MREQAVAAAVSFLMHPTGGARHYPPTHPQHSNQALWLGVDEYWLHTLPLPSGKLGNLSIPVFFFFLNKDSLYLFDRESEYKRGQQQAEGERGAGSLLSRGLNP